MDGYSDYNQIKMHLDDVEMIAFRPKVVFCYQVMPLGLKKCLNIYQRALTVILKEMLGDMVGN